MHPALVVFLYGAITAVATGLGAFPFLFVRAISDRVTALSKAVAGGLMLGASFGLVAEGTQYGSAQTIAGAVLGVGFILIAQRYLGERDLHFGAVRGADARQMALIV
ncbi:MAG: ZIP family metal transporter, partial [Gemmatimonadota bacterium]